MTRRKKGEMESSDLEKVATGVAEETSETARHLKRALKTRTL